MNEIADDLDDFESQLTHLRPQPLRRELVDRIAAQLERTPTKVSWADQCLMTFMGGGALAASVIVGLLSWQTILGSSRRSLDSPAPRAARPLPGTIGEYERALARADGPTSELFR